MRGIPATRFGTWTLITTVLVTAGLLLGSLAHGAGGTDNSLVRVASDFTPPVNVSIVFAANNSGEVKSLLTTDKPYIRAGDSFELVSGVPWKRSLNLSQIDSWAGQLRAAYPDAKIYAGTAGIAHFTSLARKVSSQVSGIFYDYEPGYEPGFTGNFSQTVSEFENVTAIAHARGLLSIGYPTGRPIATAQFRADNWSYGILAKTVDALVVQTQAYCHNSTPSFANATTTVLDQYAAADAPGLPTFQVTLGVNTSLTPNQVSPSHAYSCAKVLAHDGLKTLYLWFGPGSNVDVVRFLKDLGRE
jgi:hypothetical protein